MSKILFIQGIYNELAGRRDQALAELETYLEHPAGVGEHSDISAEIKKKLHDVAQTENQLIALQRHFGPSRPEGEANQTSTPSSEESSSSEEQS